MTGSSSNQKSFRKAIGALKDSTQVGLAKVNSDYKGLDIAIVKATNHDEHMPKDKYVCIIFDATSASRPRADVAYCIQAIAKCLAKTRNWAVALKTLMIVHRALREVDPTFREELINYTRNRGQMLNISHFKDDSSPNAWDYSGWVRTYALYLEERLECFRILKYDARTEHSIGDNSKYATTGPPFLILLHPALGPLWEVSRQKFWGGSISEGSELKIEVAEFLWRDVELDGSLIVVAENVMGATKVHGKDEPILQYGHRCGRCKLRNVKVLNKGVDWNSAENIYWMHKVRRFETVKIILHGNAEFEATDVVLKGNHVFEVPNAYRLQISSGNAGISTKLDPIKKEMMDTGSWFWKYTLKGTHIHLEMAEL